MTMSWRAKAAAFLDLTARERGWDLATRGEIARAAERHALVGCQSLDVYVTDVLAVVDSPTALQQIQAIAEEMVRIAVETSAGSSDREIIFSVGEAAVRIAYGERVVDYDSRYRRDIRRAYQARDEEAGRRIRKRSPSAVRRQVGGE